MRNSNEYITIETNRFKNPCDKYIDFSQDIHQ